MRIDDLGYRVFEIAGAFACEIDGQNFTQTLDTKICVCC